MGGGGGGRRMCTHIPLKPTHRLVNEATSSNGDTFSHLLCSSACLSFLFCALPQYSTWLFTELPFNSSTALMAASCSEKLTNPNPRDLTERTCNRLTYWTTTSILSDLILPYSHIAILGTKTDLPVLWSIMTFALTILPYLANTSIRFSSVKSSPKFLT